ncbi:uncharacterized protein LOC104877936 [Vitis vinifera]|uniref:uncharacterized protein LOC104877936 n=1 Tax=Vitis vinifera TaxID=29760 RepID=UPI00288320D4|nr:uncharacterized protein LOC104877936 [Vitis vinifera]
MGANDTHLIDKDDDDDEYVEDEDVYMYPTDMHPDERDANRSTVHASKAIEWEHQQYENIVGTSGIKKPFSEVALQTRESALFFSTTLNPRRFYIALEPRRMGYLVAVERFVKIMAMVWAGSQVTKLVRARGALALAPIVDRGLSWFTVKFRFESQGKAFMAIVGFYFRLALILFFIVILLWA